MNSVFVLWFMHAVSDEQCLCPVVYVRCVSDNKKNCHLFNLLKLENSVTDIHYFWHTLC